MIALVINTYFFASTRNRIKENTELTETKSNIIEGKISTTDTKINEIQVKNAEIAKQTDGNMSKMQEELSAANKTIAIMAATLTALAASGSSERPRQVRKEDLKEDDKKGNSH